ncbi:MAG: hypothetical protein M5U34_37190 [Chloroflexi bacterium]|nr:hypothetical protein [Chloroflexota bacterium]
MNIPNLDQKAAQYAQKIIAASLEKGSAKEVENLITKTLGVLQEQGIYAMILFLFSRTSKEEKIAPAVRTQLYDLLKELSSFANIEDENIPQAKANAEDVLRFFSDTICDNLNTLLLVKDVYEQTLIYARYSAKAANKESA